MSASTKGISAIYAPFLPSQRVDGNVSPQELALIVISSGGCFPTSGPLGALAALPAPAS